MTSKTFGRAARPTFLCASVKKQKHGITITLNPIRYFQTLPHLRRSTVTLTLTLTSTLTSALSALSALSTLPTLSEMFPPKAQPLPHYRGMTLLQH